MPGEKLLRLSALFVLCGLVYYFSFDHGRTTALVKVERLEAENESLRLQLALQSREIATLKSSDSVTTGQPANPPVNIPSSTSSVQPDSRQKLTIKRNENRILFGDRLVLTVMEIDSFTQEVQVRLHYLESGRRESTLLKSGETLDVDFGEESYRLLLERLQGPQVFFVILTN